MTDDHGQGLVQGDAPAGRENPRRKDHAVRKIPTLFVRDWDGDRRYVLPQVTPGCEWVVNGECKPTRFGNGPTRKYDGTCVMLATVSGWWARREVKPDKIAPPGFVALETDPESGKTAGWEPLEQSGFARWHAEALADPYGVADFWPTREPVPGQTYELIGPRINGNPEKVDHHVLIRHGYMASEEQDLVRDLPLNFDGLAAWLHAHDWEGIVWHHDDGRMTKIKRRDFRRPA
jgi:hypothetical protein